MIASLAFQRWRMTLGGLAAALALIFFVATPQGQVAAAEFLAQFRSQRLAVVTFDPEQMRRGALGSFDRLGTLLVNGQAVTPGDRRAHAEANRSRQVGSVQEASRETGLAVVQPDPATLPAGVNRTPTIRVMPAQQSRLTFDRQKAREYFDSIGRKDLSLPDRLQGTSLMVAVPPVVMLEYKTADGKPSLMIGQTGELQVGTEGGASLAEVRDFLLGLPNLPKGVADQLRSFQDWRTTLPIPVPVDKVAWQDTTIAGAPGLLLNDNSGLGSAAIWQQNGRIYGVAGPMKANELVKIANSLRP
ncbi:MAG: hypothetical protein IT305_19675 [Chloroflexi bacterium]|nr:hypothetical protein [Chloroflexota bacterium]